MSLATLRRYPGNLFLVSTAFVMLSLASYYVLRILLSESFELLLSSESVFVIAGLTIALLVGSQGPLDFVIMVPVAILAFAEELFVNGTLVWLGLLLAFFGLVSLPAIAIFFRKESSDVSDVLEVTALMFATRLVLVPFPVDFLQSSTAIPIIYALILCALVAYIWIRRLPLAEVGLTLGKGHLPTQVALGLACGAVLGVIELNILHPPSIAFGPSLLVNVAYILITMLAFVALTEELLYRGLIQVRLAKIMPKWQAVHICAFLFALFSIGWFNPLELIFAYAAGVVFGYLMFRYDSLIGPIMAHGFGNVVLYLLTLGV